MRYLQVLAPFVLDNLNCTGSEERLLDCPGATGQPYDDYVNEYRIVGNCDPLGGTYAFVACGTEVGPGEHRVCVCHDQTALGNAAFQLMSSYREGRV